MTAVKSTQATDATPPDDMLDGTIPVDRAVLDGGALDARVLDGKVLDSRVLDGGVLDGAVLDGGVLVQPVDLDAEVARVPFTDLEFVVIDVETTGWTPEDSGITEIGAVRVRRGEIVAEYTSLVNPGGPVPEPIAELTGISDQMLAPAPPVAAVLPGLLAFAGGCVLTAHNARFDLGFLRAACAASGLSWPGYPVIDTLRLARQLIAVPDEAPDCKLRTLADLFGTPVRPSHRALADARATAWVLRQLLARLDGRGITTLADLMPWLEALEAAQAAEAAEAEARAAEDEARAAADESPAVEGEAPAGAAAKAEAEAAPGSRTPAAGARPEAKARPEAEEPAASEPPTPEAAAGR